MLIAWFGSLGYALTRIGLAAGPLSHIGRDGGGNLRRELRLGGRRETNSLW
jgi:hypothetical protein